MPLVYVKRSVMVIEPMAEVSVGVREGIEKGKFRNGLRGRGAGTTGKRKREESEDEEADKGKDVKNIAEGDEQAVKKKKRTKGPKGPNPLSVKKPKKATEDEPKAANVDSDNVEIVGGTSDQATRSSGKRKRKRRPKSQQLAGMAVADGSDQVQVRFDTQT